MTLWFDEVGKSWICARSVLAPDFRTIPFHGEDVLLLMLIIMRIALGKRFSIFYSRLLQ
jgi:hypothetical protein